jgi:hypothetical protein
MTMRAAPVLTALLLLSLVPPAPAAERADRPLSRAERTGYEETSRHEDVLRFFAELQTLSGSLRVETLGHSKEGRELPLVVLADPPIGSPREARSAGKPVVLVMANIHAGEVEGKEAAQHLCRRLLLGDLRPLLDKLVVLVIPDYNADGNDRISMENRTAQNGPVGGVGRRENAMGLDLNRDYMKAEAPETQALLRLFARWDPHLTVDLHTTNGTHHGYHLTYSIPLNPSADPRIGSYQRNRMMPALADAMLNRHKFRTYYYGNVAGPAPKPGEPDRRSWRAFTHAPRVGTNYVGLRNRLAILSEAYSYLSFRRRVEATEAFVEEILRYTAAHADELTQLTRRVDADTTLQGRTGGRLELGVLNEARPLPEPVEILLGAVTKVKNPRSGHDMTAMVEDRVTPVRMPDLGTFVATRTVPVPGAYLFRDEPANRVLLDKLREHGVAVEELLAPCKLDVDAFAIEDVRRATRDFQGHREVRLTGRLRRETVDFPAGTFLVREGQPLARLAAYLLEPESDDGLAAWNFLDAQLGPGKVYPVFKLAGEARLPCRLLDRPPGAAAKGPDKHKESP